MLLLALGEVEKAQRDAELAMCDRQAKFDTTVETANQQKVEEPSKPSKDHEENSNKLECQGRNQIPWVKIILVIKDIFLYLCKYIQFMNNIILSYSFFYFKLINKYKFSKI